MLVACLRTEGLTVLGGRPPQDPARPPAFLASHPAVVVFDVQPPYEAHLRTVRRLRAAVFPEAALLLTTTDGHRLRRWLEKDEVRGVFVKPCNLEQLVAAIRDALKAQGHSLPVPVVLPSHLP